MAKRNTLWSLPAALAVLGGIGAAQPALAQNNGVEVNGTIVSIRGGILQVRPNLRPKWIRVAVDDSTVILDYGHATKDQVTPGMRVLAGGAYVKSEGFHPRFIEFSEKPVAYLTDKSHGLQVDEERGRARVLGTLKSLEPFVVTDDDGKDVTGSLDRLNEVWHVQALDHTTGLLIGTKISVEGTAAADGVIRATTIYPDRNFAQAGTMFGRILDAQGDVIHIEPRYTTDNIAVKREPGCVIEREVAIDPDTINIGDTVTFWVQRGGRGRRGGGGYRALALLIGEQRYPNAAEGEGANDFLTGKIASLNPVKLALPDGTVTPITIPAQMAIATLKPLGPDDLKSGEKGMFVLSRNPDGSFRTRIIVLDASPWVGYGW